jgi:DNA-binding Xre family transcriptional regulator
MALYRRGQRVPESEIPPEVKAGDERRRRERGNPEYREALEKDIAVIRREIPPATVDPCLAALLASLRAEREKQGISLTAAAERSGIDRAMLSKLETGRIPNPTFSTLRVYTAALGLHLRMVAEPDSNPTA